MASVTSSPFHGYPDAQKDLVLRPEHLAKLATSATRHFTILERKLSYRFHAHFHPYVRELIQRLIERSVRGLQEADTDYVRKADGSLVTLPDGKPKPVLYADFFQAQYQPAATPPPGPAAPATGVFVDKPYPVKDLDFTSAGAYSVYNWELFFHVPLTIAIHLSKNQRFEEAMQWFHLVFDPTDDSDGPTPERFWRVKPFQFTDVKLIEEVLVNLATGADPVLWQDTVNSIGAWKDAPFRPHVVARYRQSAYMFKTVMAYLDNLIAWGDSLFRQDTPESINEATQLYVLAANILGPRPQAVPRKGSVRPQTYANLRADLDQFGNALRNIETDIPFDLTPMPGEVGDAEQLQILGSIGRALYFCVPRNDKLLDYWGTVADRLFKIRNSLNILGVFRQLPLFDPPIDPALLARAAAAGLDVGAVVSGVNQPLPLVRFQTLVQKAVEICQEVKSLGNGLLAALEKEDNEALAVLRARHERVILGLAEMVRYGQWQEAVKAREGLEKSLAIVVQRYRYYERLLGKSESDITIPEIEALAVDQLDKKRLEADEPEVALRDLVVDIAQDLGAAGGKLMSSHEAEELEKLETARWFQGSASSLEALGGVLAIIPQFKAHAQPMGCGATVDFGGQHLHSLSSSLAAVARTISDQYSYEANQAAKIGSYARREQEWALQGNLAAGEINQTFKQIRAAQVREALAEREWKNHQQQIKHAEETENFLKGEKVGDIAGKTSTQGFYAWMKREAKALHGQCFQFAFDVARKAERALQHELGDPRLSFLQFGYLAGKEGLLAGEKLYLDIKRMEMAHIDLNQREYELTRHVSLLQVNPHALVRLRATGRCTVFLPEELFDMDGPGHYFRRLRTVAVSIPCVTGPYTSVNCTLTLLKSSIRRSPLLRDGAYARDGADDDRFSDHFGSLNSIVTSSGQNDEGLFETNLRDERYLPFEGSGAVSEWQLELPAEVRQFDHDTISDVILHLRYTAREGGGLLRAGAVANLKTHLDEAQTVGSIRLFSVRHEFPTEWARFTGSALTPAAPLAELVLNLREEHYPYWSRGRLLAVKRAECYARAAAATKAAIKLFNQRDDIPPGTRQQDELTTDPSLGDLRTGRFVNIPLPTPTGKWTLYLDDNSMEDLWLALAWGAND